MHHRRSGARFGLNDNAWQGVNDTLNPHRIRKRCRSRLIEAVLSVSANNDEVIREMAGSDASATLVKIRELVCT